ncbi:MAG TPA: arsenate reductase ArsC [Sulfurovum sp.]|nr:arsenate reductase ArsC [Sulfurovum sp.]
MRKVLILCTGNSCRSIIAEALINKHLNNVIAYSAGVKAIGKVNSRAIEVLKQEAAWSDDYFSKNLDKVIDINFDLVVTVCSNANDNCPIFPKKTEVIHVGFEDPDGKEFRAFEETLKEIKRKLLPIVRKKTS